MRGKHIYDLESVNERLKAGLFKVRVIQRGESLKLRATLPPKPGSDRPKPWQQTIPLSAKANESGFCKAEKKARQVSAELDKGVFDWADYISIEKLPAGKPVATWVKEFKAHYRETHDLMDSTWANHWQRVYDRLPQNQPLTPEALMVVVNSTDRNTRNRSETCRKLQNLADFAKIDVDLLQYKGKYGPKMVAPRDLPAEEEIVYWWHQIRNPDWKWAFAAMAAFGVRDHELFFAEWTDDGLFVKKGKTGPRLVFQPLYPEWVDQFDLRNIRYPKIRDVEKSYKNGKLGDKVAREFRRQGIPFPPYDLRHCYGIRASVTFKFPVTTAAALMGHSPTIHLQRYHKHIQLETNRAAAKQVMDRSDRPKPPAISFDA